MDDTTTTTTPRTPTTARSTALVLGAMSFGTTVDEDTSFALLDRFVERGGRWIDTADCYSFWTSDSGRGGDSERVLGRWLAARPGMREQVLIATKVGAEPLWAGSWPARRSGLSPRAVHQAFEGSLERLGTDHVDLLWWHAEDRSVPIELVVDGVGELTADGRVRRVGASNHPAWRVERARAHALARGLMPVDAIQLHHTYLAPRPGLPNPGSGHRFGVLSDEQRDHAAEHGMEVWAYGPLLTGAYDNPEKPLPDAFDHVGTQRRLAALDELAAATCASRSQVVFAWLVAQGIRPMIGGSRLGHLDTAFDGAALRLEPEQLALLDGAG